MGAHTRPDLPFHGHDIGFATRQQQVINQMELNQQELLFQFHAARTHVQNCGDTLADLRSTRFSRWASKADRQALQRKIVAAQEAMKQANKEEVRAQVAHNQAADALAAAHEVMGQISNEELRLRGELSGRIYYDPDTALPIQPR